MTEMQVNFLGKWIVSFETKMGFLKFVMIHVLDSMLLGCTGEHPHIFLYLTYNSVPLAYSLAASSISTVLLLKMSEDITKSHLGVG